MNPRVRMLKEQVQYCAQHDIHAIFLRITYSSIHESESCNKDTQKTELLKKT